MTDYNKLKVTELKELLKERGIPSTGLSRKQQIVEALEANDAETAGGEEVAVEEGGGESSGLENGQDEQGTAVEATGEEGHATAERREEQQAEEPIPAEEVPAQDQAPSEEAKEEPMPAIEPSVTEMEKNEPLSKEPSVINTPNKASSPAAESASSETRKRKRRSKTPPFSQETVNKKLKSAEDEVVKLPEDEMKENAPVAVDPPRESMEVEEKTVMPSSVSDDVMDTSSMPVAKATVEEPRSTSPMKVATPPDTEEAEDVESSGPPSTHPATRAIYIRELVRPLQPQQLRDHLVEIATSPPSEDAITTFHLDTLRTHAFVVFSTKQAASTARSVLHGTIWPDEPSRKALWVDFIPEAKVQDWIDEESSGGRRDAKKWEVVYDTDSDGHVIASHQEALPPAPGMPRQSSFSTNTPVSGVPNAPLGPRADRPSSTSLPTPREPPKPTRQPSNATFDVLDERFHHTSSKPKLYWLPAEQSLVDRRILELEQQTSRSWEDGRAMRGATAIEGQLRRYTFEDGDKIVDNGADIPSFRSEGGRPDAPRGGRGRGGFRGGRGR